jgi:putative Mg2+ transporter-C (MgtC) family protein
MDWNLVLWISISLLLSLVLGFAIGFERKMRFKEAGMRTHTIVCLGSCLYMIISLHAFGGDADPARVAAQIVPGIGFIGAGIIFYHKEVVRGLTTAAGIWATAAIGMAVGVGSQGKLTWMFVAVIATACIILIQCVMHLPFSFFHSRKFVKINIVFKDEDGSVADKVKAIFAVQRFNKISAKKEGEEIVYSVIITTDHIISAQEIHKALMENPDIVSIARQDDDF